MKKVLFAAIAAIALQASAFAAPDPDPKPATVVTEKVMKAFSQTFNTAQNILWSEAYGVFEARFTYNDIITRVRYDEDGNVLRTIRYYYEQQLPLNVLTKVKQQFSGQKVHSITEESTGDLTVYHIVLEDEKHWTMVDADNGGGVVQTKKLVKA